MEPARTPSSGWETRLDRHQRVTSFPTQKSTADGNVPFHRVYEKPQTFSRNELARTQKSETSFLQFHCNPETSNPSSASVLIETNRDSFILTPIE
jgi:hypothetical protein